jgi:hypothetical protein
MSETEPYAHLVSERECDFVEALAALHELLGSTVTVWILGSHTESRQAAVTISARVLGGLELGEDTCDPVGIQIGDALLVLSPESLGRATRQEYERRADGVRWTVVGLELRSGVRVEIDERPDA